MIKILQVAHPRDPLPSQFMDWARAANITVDSEREQVPDPDLLHSTKIEEPVIMSRTGTIPKSRPQPSITQVGSPINQVRSDRDFRNKTDSHVSEEKQTSQVSVMEEMVRTMSDMRRKQDMVVGHTNKQLEQANKRLEGFQKTIMEVSRSVCG